MHIYIYTPTIPDVATFFYTRWPANLALILPSKIATRSASNATQCKFVLATCSLVGEQLAPWSVSNAKPACPSQYPHSSTKNSVPFQHNSVLEDVVRVRWHRRECGRCCVSYRDGVAHCAQFDHRIRSALQRVWMQPHQMRRQHQEGAQGVEACCLLGLLV